MTFNAKVENPNSVVVSLSIELTLAEATRLIEQLGQIRDGLIPYPASTVRDGLGLAVRKVSEQITEELVPERNQS